jgi:hypothetical protein
LLMILVGFPSVKLLLALAAAPCDSRPDLLRGCL